MMKTRLLVVILSILMVLALFGCTSEETKENEKEINEQHKMTKNIKNEYDKATYILDKSYEKTNDNVIFSPLSLNMALGMVSEGATGETKEELSSFLNQDNYTKYASKYMNWIDNYEGVELANSVWINEKENIKKYFKENVKNNFKADVITADFKDKTKTVSAINNWSNEKTHGMIPKIITEEFITDDSKVVLVNSLYFESAWENKFTLTEKAFTFTKFDNSKQIVDKLSGEENIYYENKKAIAFAKDYENGIKFIGILPKQNGEFSVSDLDIKSLLKNKTTEYDVRVAMPKVNYEATCEDLVQSLKELGIKTAFDGENADFSEMIELNSNENLYISDVVQKCKIELDEEKTKAAAVTAIGMAELTCAAPVEKEYKEVILDRPFAYLIYDEANDEVLFIGKVVNIE